MQKEVADSQAMQNIPNSRSARVSHKRRSCRLGRKTNSKPGSNTLKTLISILLIPFVVSACGGGSDAVSSAPVTTTPTTTPTTTHVVPISTADPKAKFIAAESFSFDAAIDPATLTVVPEKYFALYNSFHSAFDRTYAIASAQQLEAFNQKVSANEKISLDNFDAFTYFLIKAPRCPDFFEYANNTYERSTLVITLNHFTVLDVACAAVMVQSYYVFRARK